MPDTTTQTHRVSDELQLSWAGVTDRGRRRENNQDAFLVSFPLFVIADGMGGHAGGEIASQSTIARLEEMVAEGEVSDAAIQAALQRAVDDIHDHPETTDEGTGTTLTGAYLDRTDDGSARWTVLNIGDSRVYLARDDRLTQVTTDHSVVQELIASGKISPEEADGHPYSNVITRAVGASELVPPDYVSLDLRDGDRLVICSDGLTKELTDYGILHFLREHDDPGAAVDAMLDAALENGGRDNVTLIVVRVALNESSSAADESTSAIDDSSSTIDDSGE
ncbi:protein phosphatase 2C domain-containing protein [Microbacterium sp. ARD32]|uniref:PP2C family protein-serine/threonine phosphatase n=1 Tax=Microbacterium sp. ARD32 TaxID=2962577 RepID=UPI002882B30A|nr:protein phosphatase 2C domain-containing protein [Microbacterium sp. ARD32]MDT0156880.1 protein phosphatase 2C domain-containing protein [Microbacterium sp. ARD32]